MNRNAWEELSKTFDKNIHDNIEIAYEFCTSLPETERMYLYQEIFVNLHSACLFFRDMYNKNLKCEEK